MTMTRATVPAVGNELFVHNMRALWRSDPALALKVDAVPDEERHALIKTKSGHHTARLSTTDGVQVYLHSRYDPIVEAERLVAEVDVDENYCFVVVGLGLGYHLRALDKRLRGDAFIVCTEPCLSRISTALCCTDLADMIESRRMVFLVDDDKARLHDRLNDRNTLILLGAQFVHHAPSRRLDEVAQAAITKAITEFISYMHMSIVTLVSNARITCKNIAMNVVNYVSTPPIDLLRNRFPGNPAIVISAGPSLTRNIDQLAGIKGKAVLCAVQTTLKPLAQRGIVPDFVTSLDFHEMSRKFFERVDHLEEIHLVAEPKATWHVLDDYPGPVSLLDNAWARMILGESLGARDGLASGATVSHLAFYLAVYMGCDPIIFVGQDLAFTGHVFYVPGVEIHQTWRSELNRFCTLEMKEWDRIARNRPILHKVPDPQGGELYTDELLLTYLEQFEKDIVDTGARVINATEGGAMIRGTETLSLQEAAKRFCSEPIDPARFAYLEQTRWRSGERLGEAEIQLETRLEEMKKVISVCDELLELLEKLKPLTNDPPRFNQLIIRVDELRNMIQQDGLAFRIVNSFTQLAELRRYTADRRVNALQGDEKQRAERQIARDVDFIQQVREGAEALQPVLGEALDRVVRARATRALEKA